MTQLFIKGDTQGSFRSWISRQEFSPVVGLLLEPGVTGWHDLLSVTHVGLGHDGPVAYCEAHPEALGSARLQMIGGVAGLVNIYGQAVADALPQIRSFLKDLQAQKTAEWKLIRLRKQEEDRAHGIGAEPNTVALDQQLQDTRQDTSNKLGHWARCVNAQSNVTEVFGILCEIAQIMGGENGSDWRKSVEQACSGVEGWMP